MGRRKTRDLTPEEIVTDMHPYNEWSEWHTRAAVAEIGELVRRTAQAIGSGLLAVDLFETQAGYSVNEVNHTMEFRNSISTTGVNIPEKMIDYILSRVPAVA